MDIDKDKCVVQIGTPFTAVGKRLLLLGSGELGKEIIIEAQRLGLETIACDHYLNAPAMQVADRSHMINMLDHDALMQVVISEKPDWIVPEIEAINTQTLLTLEQSGYRVIPTAAATQMTMDREKIRDLAAKTLNLPTSSYRFVDNKTDYLNAVEAIGFPCVVKPIMSSSGKGQSKITQAQEIPAAWDNAQQGGRVTGSRVIVEQWVDFDEEITLLTVRHSGGTQFCAPIGHHQVGGDYLESWQPHPLSATVLTQAQHIAKTITDALGGFGLYGVELFIKGEQVLFSEVSPRPHDTGLVTLISQDLSEFALHVRALLGLPIPTIHQYGPAASHAIVVQGQSQQVVFSNLSNVLQQADTHIHLFGKPEVQGRRRMGVVLALADTIGAAREKARLAAQAVNITL